MTTSENMLEMSKRIHALAEIGLTYFDNLYDTEHYEALFSVKYVNICTIR